MHCNGFVASGYEPVREAFEGNLRSGRDVGAAFAVYQDGHLVVDLWGGFADVELDTPWSEDTLVLVYSTTKGAAAACANHLGELGQLELSAPVAEYWPEFAQSGKASVTVEQVLSHQAGLPYVDAELTLREVLDNRPLVAALERQAPLWEPGSAHGYHAVTFGTLVGEIVRRVSGRSLGVYFQDEIAVPFDLDFYIGLPDSETSRVAPIIGRIGLDESLTRDNPEVAKLVDQFMGPDTPLGKALSVNGAFDRHDGIEAPGGNVFNSPEVQAAELPAANGITDARSLARFYAACIGEVDGARILGENQMRSAARQRTHGGNRILHGIDLQFGLGFFVHSTVAPYGGEGSFGHGGAGGSLGWADPDAGLAIGYVMNRMEMGLTGDERASSLIDAAYASARH